MFKVRRVAVGVSGGVDSSVAALLLKKAGYEVEGVFMKNWDNNDETGICSAEKDFQDAQIICKKIGIPLVRIDFIKQYWNDVFSNLLKSYEFGYTPNPDILCNKNIKFKLFYDHCRNNLNVDAIATGHYANTSFGPFLENFNPDAKIKLLCPIDLSKDQTFFLSQIDQESLKHTMFPLALLKKVEVRKIAKENNLYNVANKKDSYGICFVGKRNFKKFISEYIPPKPGEFIDFDTGKTIGVHNGIHQWTVGQRCNIGGLHIAYFIYRKTLENNCIYVVGGTNHSSLQNNIIITNQPHWISEEPKQLTNNSVLNCYFRYQNVLPLVECQIMKTKNNLLVKISKDMRAIAPGQYAVFYYDNECLGSAQIIHLGPSQVFCT